MRPAASNRRRSCTAEPLPEGEQARGDSEAPGIAELRGCSKITYEADVAQLVEQLIRNQQVIGSSPIVGSRLLLTAHGSVQRELLCNSCTGELLLQ